MQANQTLPDLDASDALASALRTIATEREGVDALAHALKGELGVSFARATEILAAISGRVIVTGVGKSGHIGSKLAATFASTGTPAYFVHPVEANHGDLGMVTRDDAIVAMSWSGESSELKGIVAYSRRFSIPLIAITSGPESALARHADTVLCLPKAAEACPHGLAPTTSTVLQLAIGDALAIALLERRKFTADHFRAFHPGGQLGANLTQVADIMHAGERVPLIPVGASMRDAVLEMSRKGFGCVAVCAADGRLAGIVTDGDLRRNLANDLLDRTVEDIMTADPKAVAPDTIAAVAIRIINGSSITSLMVVDDDRRPLGIVHLHDLLRIGAA